MAWSPYKVILMMKRGEKYILINDPQQEGNVCCPSDHPFIFC